MLYNEACHENLSRLGFGCMRLPQKDGEIDMQEMEKMVDLAISNGVNYFDTAWPYHAGKSEIAIGKILSRYPKEKWYLANKYPGHQISESYKPAEIFEEQLKKCGVEYFDFYLLHNVYENSIGVYKDPKWGILDYFKEQKEKGRIKHMGFSTHARPDTLEAFLDYAGDAMEFCQIQLNYLDYTLQDAKAKVELLSKRGIPIWVMEPLRGGRLSTLPEDDAAKLSPLRPGSSLSSFAFRFLQAIPEVKVILSGMSNLSQMEDNIKTFTDPAPQTEEEKAVLLAIAEDLKDAVPCTRCRYCCEGCPMQLDIPMLIHAYNDLKFGGSNTVPMQFDALPAEKQPSACLGCGACAAVCPQNIDIPSVLQSLSEKLAAIPSWAEICRRREEAARKLKEAKGEA